MAYLASVLGALARAECQFGQPSPAAFSPRRAAAFSPVRERKALPLPATCSFVDCHITRTNPGG
uniref:Uncharacterized protein n=1 Tax=Oryza glaberrima TaxID=4538 RepID=I1NT25_ORYGL